jgi:diacylglycerol kinase family enzyme
MERIGMGLGVAVLLNGRAKRVTPKVVRALERTLPRATICVSEDLDQAKRHVAQIMSDRPVLLLSGAGDGGMVKLLNLLREVGAKPFPTLGILPLGTGNAWARVAGASDCPKLLDLLPRLPLPLPTTRFDLVEVENTLCHFAGVGWDARILNDYLRNLDRRSAQLVGSRIATRLHKGLGGYMYSLFRITVPEEWRLLRDHGQARVTVTNQGDAAYTLDALARPVEVDGSRAGGLRSVLFEGPLSVGAGATTPEWGFGFRAFPHARAKPGTVNLRVYDRPVLEGVANMARLWRGAFPLPGMHDYFVTRAELGFSRPMPFQIGGDGLGLRDSIVLSVAKETVEVVDWGASRATAAGSRSWLPRARPRDNDPRRE